ncbi:MAG: histidinol-phosphatase [Rhodospirillaceae bacterium]|nr:histidinol-phosphatase [Rhodospirillaceae bacterium]
MGVQKEFIDLAVRSMDKAREVTLGNFRTGINIDTKADASPVTIADREAERIIREMINAEFPDHGILGEEFGPENIDAEWVWVLDPIDGTAGFVTGKPLFGTLVALARGGKPVFGAIDAPAMNERWLGAEGMPTTMNGKAVKVRECANLNDAWLYATTPDMFIGENKKSFENLSTAVKRTNYGADCYAYGLLASGHVDLVCEASLGTYDFMALVPVVTGAGGIMTDWQGKSLDINSDGRVVAAGSKNVHGAALEKLGN